MSKVLTTRARHAALSRHRPKDDPAVVEAARDHAAAKLAAHIAEVVDSAAAPTDEQRDRLAGLLRPTAGGPDAA